MIPVAFMNTYYLPRPAYPGENITAFPKGLRMLQGNPFRRTFDGSSPDDLAISYVCLDYSGSHANDPAWAQRNSFFEHNCPDGMRAQVNFRSCWDGVNLDSPDHASHMAWPSGGVNGGSCPSSHPIHLPMLFYEVIYNTGSFPFNPAGTPTWVFSEGDTTGYSMHGDFVMGWEDAPDGTNVLQAAIDGCNANDGVGGELQNCPPFVPFLNQASANSCRPQNALVNEDIGNGHGIAALPGNNPVTIGNTTYASSAPKPGYVNTTSSIPSGYSYVGCVGEPSSGRALSAATYVNATGMTRGGCVSFCSSRGYPYAGIEYGQECRCDTQLRNGANTTQLLSASKCGMACSGLSTENCGGPSTFDLFVNQALLTAANAHTSTIPSGYTLTGCIAEGSSGRALTGASTTSASGMSRGACVAFCQSKGFALAGVEYGQECYCGSQLVNGATNATLLDASSRCGMPCSNTSVDETCGGSATLLLYTNPSLFPAASAPLPQGWAYDGCRIEAASGRTLASWAYTSTKSMTRAACVQACASRNFTLAGVEYGRECYCASAYTNGGGALATQDSQCNMACSGDSGAICGGPSRLSSFKLTAQQAVGAVAKAATSSSAVSTTAKVMTVKSSSAASTSAKTSSASSITVNTTSTKTALSTSSATAAVSKRRLAA